MKHRAAERQAERARGLELAAVDRLDAGPEHLGDVGAGVERQRGDAGEEGAVVLLEVTRRIAGDDEAVGRIDEQRHDREVHEQ